MTTPSLPSFNPVHVQMTCDYCKKLISFYLYPGEEIPESVFHPSCAHRRYKIRRED